LPETLRWNHIDGLNSCWGVTAKKLSEGRNKVPTKEVNNRQPYPKRKKVTGGMEKVMKVPGTQDLPLKKASKDGWSKSDPGERNP